MKRLLTLCLTICLCLFFSACNLKNALISEQDIVTRDGKNGASLKTETTLYQQQKKSNQPLKNAPLNLQSKSAIYLNNVAEMKTAPLIDGATVVTKGYYNINDGGAALYTIRAKTNTDIDNGGSVIFLNNKLVAQLLVNDKGVDVQQFGAVGDGVTDDTEKIQTCLDFCQSNNYLCLAHGTGKKFYIAGKISTTCEMDFSQVTFVSDAKSNTIVLQIGDPTLQGAGIIHHNYKLPHVINQGHHKADGWKGYENSIGVSIVNIFTSSIYLQSVNGFGIGLEVAGDNNKGVSYNNFFGGTLRNNKINLQCISKTDHSWCSANTFFTSRIRLDAGERNGDVPFAGTKNVYLKKAGDNVFIHPCVEGSTLATEYGIDILNSNNNLFISPRLEAQKGQNKMPVRFDAEQGKACTGNVLFGGYAVKEFNVILGNGLGQKGPNEILATKAGAKILQTSPEMFRNVKGAGQPNLMGFSSNYKGNIFTETSNSTAWSWKITSQSLQGKNYIRPYPQIDVRFDQGRIYYDKGTAEPTLYLGYVNETGLSDGLTTNSTIYPYNSGAIDLGSVEHTWKDIHLENAPTVKSDRNQKQQIRELSEQEKAVAIRCKKLIRAYKLNSDVKQNGEKSIFHIGVIAQDIVEAFNAEGLNALEYGIVYCEKDKEKQSLYSIRYDELLAFIISAL